MLNLEGDWKETISDMRSAGFSVIQVDEIPTGNDKVLSTIAIPPYFLKFFEDWRSNQYSLWETFVRSINSFPYVNANELSTVIRSDVGQILQHIVSQAHNVAFFSGSSNIFKSPDSWGYLLQIGPRIRDDEPHYVRIYNPVIPQELAKAEAVLQMQLSPSYSTLLRITNGLGLDAFGRKEIVGAGSQRAEWSEVLQGHWSNCAYYREITASWREFQGIYQEERKLSTGLQFLSDESMLVPFLRTNGGDSWCFDRSRPRAGSEYPIVYWDHELCQASDEYPDFANWMVAELAF